MRIQKRAEQTGRDLEVGLRILFYDFAVLSILLFLLFFLL